MAEPEFRYFAAVPEKGLVTRYGTGTYIGANRDHEDPRKINFTVGEVVAIPEAEYHRYRREYDKQVRSGALKKCTQRDFEAYAAEQTKQSEADAAALKLAQETEAKEDAEAAAKVAKTETEPDAAPETPKKKGNKK
jgi:hypothetical protein